MTTTTNIPSQNNLNAIIKSQIAASDEIINLLIVNAKKCINFKNAKKSLDNYLEVVKYIFSKDGILSIITTLINNINVKKNNIDLKSLESLYLNVINSINNILNTIYELKLYKFLSLKLFIIRLQFISILMFFNRIYFHARILSIQLKLCLSSLMKLKLIEEVITVLHNIFESIYNIKVNDILLWFKIKQIKNGLKKLYTIINLINKFSRYYINPNAIKNFLSVSIALTLLSYIFKVIRHTKIGMFLWLKLLILKASIKLLQDIIRKINLIKINKKIFFKLIQLVKIFKKIRKIFSIIFWMTPLIIISIIAIPLLTLSIILLTMGLKIIIKAIKSLGKSLLKAILILVIIQAFIVSISIIMVLLTLSAVLVVGFAKQIFIFLAIVIGVVATILVIGFLLAAVAPYISIALAGFLFVIVTIGLLLIIAKMLEYIATLKIDKEKIKENVKTIVNSVFLVIDAIFRSDETEDEEGDSMFASVLKFAGKTIVSLIKIILAIPFLLRAIVAITLMCILALQLEYIQNLQLDPAKITENVRAVMSTCQLVIDAIFNGGDAEAEQSDKNWLESLLSYIGTGLISIVKVILAVRYLAVAVIAIFLILLLAKQLEYIQNLQLDPAKIAENVRAVMSTCQLVIDAIFNGEDKEGEQSDKHWLKDLFEFIGGRLISIIKVVLAVRYLALNICAIALIMLLAKQLEYIQNLQLDPNAVSKKVQDIITTCQSIVDTVFNSKDKKLGEEDEGKSGLLGFLSGLGSMFSGLNAIRKYLSAMMWMSSAIIAIGMVKQLADYLKEIIKAPDTSDVTKKVTTITTAANFTINAIRGETEFSKKDEKTAKRKLEVLNVLSKTLKKFNSISSDGLSKSAQQINNYIKFIDKINTIEVEKVKATTDMFKQMSNFSNSIKGDFDKLAESLSEKLLPVLEDLKEVIGVLPEKIDSGFNKTSASIGAVNAIPTKENIKAQVDRENPNLNKEESEKIVNDRMNEKATADANGIAAKLDELILLLKGNSGDKVKVAML